MSLNSLRPDNFYDADGGDSEASVADNDVQQLLVNILAELKISNMHLAFITDQIITEKDI